MAAQNLYVAISQDYDYVGGFVSNIVTNSGDTQAVITGGVVTAGTVLGGVNTILTVTAANDGVTLPVGMPQGTRIVVRNGGTNSANVYPPAGGTTALPCTINNGANNAALALAAAKTGEYIVTDLYGRTYIALISA